MTDNEVLGWESDGKAEGREVCQERIWRWT